MKTSMLHWRCRSNRLVRSIPSAHECIPKCMHTSLRLYSSMHRVDCFCKKRFPVKCSVEAMQPLHLCLIEHACRTPYTETGARWPWERSGPEEKESQQRGKGKRKQAWR